MNAAPDVKPVMTACDRKRTSLCVGGGRWGGGEGGFSRAPGDWRCDRPFSSFFSPPSRILFSTRFTISSASLGVLSSAEHGEAATWRLIALRRREAARAAESGAIELCIEKEVEEEVEASASEEPARIGSWIRMKREQAHSDRNAACSKIRARGSTGGGKREGERREQFQREQEKCVDVETGNSHSLVHSLSPTFQSIERCRRKKNPSSSSPSKTPQR